MPARRSLPVNGRYQIDTSIPVYLDPTSPFLAIDTETTGLNIHAPYPGFKARAQAFAIGLLEFEPPEPPNKTPIETPHLFLGQVDPYTRSVFFSPESMEAIRVLLSKHWQWVFHNSPFDIPILQNTGFDFNLDDLADYTLQDTLAASHVLDSSESHELKALAVKYLDIPDSDESILRHATQQARNTAKAHGVPTGPSLGSDYWLPKYLDPTNALLEQYLFRDIYRTARLWYLQRRILVREKLHPHYARERQNLIVDLKAMQRPVNIRYQEARNLHTHYASLRNEHESRAQQIARKYGTPDINIRSAPQLQTFLYDTLSLPVISKTKSGAPSTDKGTLPHLFDYCRSTNQRRKANFLLSLLNYRQSKTVTGYLDNYFSHSITDGEETWLYGRRNPWGTSTTRSSYSEPNLQNVGNPKEDGEEYCLRSAFGPPPGHVWIAIDFSQLEIRLIQRASGDATLKHLLDTGGDQHCVTRDQINSQRKKLNLPGLCGCPHTPDCKACRKLAKNINFAWQYGAASRTRSGKPGKLAKMAGIPADTFDEAMRAAYPDVVRFMASTSAHVRRHKYVNTLFGYRLYVPETLNPHTFSLERPEYVGTNYVIQGSAGDCCKNSKIAIDEYIRQSKLTNKIHLLLDIHDELVFEATATIPDKHIQTIAQIMSQAGNPIDCPTPVNVSLITKHWGSPQPLKLN